MGKKKDKAKRKQAEARHEAMRFDIPPQVAGIAMAALKQVDTPAFKQLIAGALGAAAQAFEQRRPASGPPAPPPAPPAPPAPEPHVATADAALPPEAERALDQAAAQVTRAVETAATLATRALENAAAAMERWAAKQAAPAPAAEPGPGPAPPHG